MANTNNYVDLITRVIGDFDSIWTSLNRKGTAVTDYQSTGNIKTENYSNIIDKLTYIKGSEGLNTATLFAANGSASGMTVNTTGGIVNEGTTFKINAKVNTAGYYEQNAPLTGTIAATAVNLATARTNNNWVLSSDKTKYTLTATNYAIGSIEAAAGTVRSEGAIIAGTYDEDGDATNTALQTVVSVADNGTNVELDENSTYVVKVKANAGTTGNVSAKTTTTVTEGYVTAADKPAAVISTLAIDSKANEEYLEFGIKAGTIEVSSKTGTTATGSITGTGSIVQSAKTNDDDYEITATVEGVQLEATVTEGYVKQGETSIVINQIATTAGKKYIKKGASNDQTIAVAENKLKVSAGSSFLDTAGKAVTIELDGVEATADIDEGYIKETEAGTITVTGSKTVYIKEADAAAKYNITSYGKSGSNIFVEGASGAYTLTVTPVVSVSTAGTTAGWIDGANDITTGAGTNNTASISYHVAAGKVEVDAAPSFSVKLTERDNDKSGQGTLTDIGDIFLGSVPAAGDYFEVETKVGYTVTEGYVTAATGTPTTKKYMPKAVIEHVDGGENGEDYYQVTKGGYLPSGVLSNISNVAPSLASVAVTLSSTTGVLSTGIASNKRASDYHKITIGKGTIDAGYISATKGTLSGEAYIAKGHASAMPSISAVKDETIARKTVEGSVIYEAKTTITANSNLSVDAGYITADEVDSATAKVTKTEDSIYQINRAVFGTTTHTTNASITASSGLTGLVNGETAKYTVTPKIDSCSTQFTVGTAGYISAADTDILKFEGNDVGHDGTMTPFAIHAGTGIASVKDAVQTGVTANNDFATASGNYTITIGGKVTKEITLDEGYYGTAEKAINVTSEVAKTVTVERGAVSAVASGTNEISATDVALHESNTATGKTFYTINANADVSVTQTITKAGYVRDTADVSVSGAKPSDVAYVEAYLGDKRSATNIAPEGTQQFTALVIGQDEEYVIPAVAPTTEETVVLATAAKYSQKDTVVTLSPHAMGSSVIDEMIRLEARLNGVIA